MSLGRNAPNGSLLRAPHRIAPFLVAASLAFAQAPAQAQPTRDSGAVAKPRWRDGVRYGGGPSVGAPPSDYTGATPPSTWCLSATRRAPGDFGVTGETWTVASRSWLRQVLSDTTELGAGWRAVLGGAPRLTPRDSIVQLMDEGECRAIAQIINREVLGWQVGPAPVVVFRIRDYLIAYPSNARRGEFGLAVGMNSRREIRGVATW